MIFKEIELLKYLLHFEVIRFSIENDSIKIIIVELMTQIITNNGVILIK